jgi:phenylacetic acid degradation operon negative regulatory protein
LNLTLDTFFKEIVDHQSISGTSLIISLYGDYLWTCGGGIWLGSLINSLEILGINQRVVRSSVFRLHKDGWLTISKVGRKSYYYLAQEKYNEVLSANKKIYHSENPVWNGKWNIIHTSLGPVNHCKDKLQYLRYKGFGCFDKDFFIQPYLKEMAQETKEEIIGKIPSAKIFQQAELFYDNFDIVENMINKSWDLSKIESEYNDFYSRFYPVFNMINSLGESSLTDEDAFKIRLLVIHFYRKIIIKDPDLPLELLPSNWPRKKTEKLTIDIYNQVHSKALNYLMNNGEAINGKLPLPSPNYYLRFGGLIK